MNLDHYSNKEAVWGYDQLTQLVQELIDHMPDLPQKIAVLLTWTDDEDESIRLVFGDSGAIYDVRPMKWIRKPLRLFFLALAPDSGLSMGDFFDGLTQAKFSESFLILRGKATLRTIRLESVEEAQAKHQDALRRMIEGPSEDPDL